MLVGLWRREALIGHSDGQRDPAQGRRTSHVAAVLVQTAVASICNICDLLLFLSSVGNCSVHLWRKTEVTLISIRIYAFLFCSFFPS